MHGNTIHICAYTSMDCLETYNLKERVIVGINSKLP